MYIADITSLDVRLKENRIEEDKSAKMKNTRQTTKKWEKKTYRFGWHESINKKSDGDFPAISDLSLVRVYCVTA